MTFMMSRRGNAMSCHVKSKQLGSYGLATLTIAEFVANNMTVEMVFLMINSIPRYYERTNCSQISLSNSE